MQACIPRPRWSMRATAEALATKQNVEQQEIYTNEKRISKEL